MSALVTGGDHLGKIPNVVNATKKIFANRGWASISSALARNPLRI